MKYSIGIDEVGRGPIAGPVVVCACALAQDVSVLDLYPKGVLRDSKKLTEKQRKSIVVGVEPFIQKKDIIYAIGVASAEYIDTYGIVPAIQSAIDYALNTLHKKGVSEDSFVFLDGGLHVNEKFSQQTIIRGDEKIVEISLASIFAKEYRDTFMREEAERFPGYGFESHVGYGTSAHYKALKEQGVTPLHRKTFLKI